MCVCIHTKACFVTTANLIFRFPCLSKMLKPNKYEQITSHAHTHTHTHTRTFILNRRIANSLWEKFLRKVCFSTIDCLHSMHCNSYIENGKYLMFMTMNPYIELCLLTNRSQFKRGIQSRFIVNAWVKLICYASCMSR